MYEYQATLVRVIDGDTVILDVDYGFHVRGRLTFRLHGLDCPERGQPGWANATEYVLMALTGKTLTVETHKGQTFGRWLATIYPTPGECSLNAALVQAGHAVPR